MQILSNLNKDMTAVHVCWSTEGTCSDVIHIQLGMGSCIQVRAGNALFEEFETQLQVFSAVD